MEQRGFVALVTGYVCYKVQVEFLLVHIRANCYRGSECGH